MMLAIKFLLITQFIVAVLSSPLSNIRFGYRQNTPENIHLLQSGDFKQNAEELSGQFEGDIILNPEQYAALNNPQRTGLINEKYRWPNETLVYQINDDFDQDQKNYIKVALSELASVTCLKFIERTNEEDYVYVQGQPEGCHSMVGRQGDKQILNLQLFKPGDGCLRLGTIMHEFIHALGFYHMQSATERDEYVKIEWKNIRTGMEHNFNKYDANRITNFGIMYDVSSVMHYSAYAFSYNGYATIVPNDISLIETLGQRNKLTQRDVERINRMYKCN